MKPGLRMILGTLIVTGVLAGATMWRSAALARATEADYPPEGEFVEIAGTRIHFVTEGSGPDLVMIHGASGSTRDFTYQMLEELRSDYRVTIFDRPGFGYSERVPEATIAQQADLLAAASRGIGLRDPIVLGQSYGGAVALAWALQGHDASALVLVSAPSNPWTTGIGTYYRVLSSPAGQLVVAPLLSAWVPDTVIDQSLMSIFEPNGAPQDYGEHIGPRLSLRLETLRENALQRRALLEQITAQAVRYPELTLPVEILHGTQDTIVPAAIHSEPLSRQLPGGELTLLDGIGHMPHHVAMEHVLEAIDRAATRAGLR